MEHTFAIEPCIADIVFSYLEFWDLCMLRFISRRLHHLVRLPNFGGALPLVPDEASEHVISVTGGEYPEEIPVNRALDLRTREYLYRQGLYNIALIAHAVALDDLNLMLRLYGVLAAETRPVIIPIYISMLGPNIASWLKEPNPLHRCAPLMLTAACNRVLYEDRHIYEDTARIILDHMPVRPSPFFPCEIRAVRCISRTVNRAILEEYYHVDSQSVEFSHGMFDNYDADDGRIRKLILSGTIPARDVRAELIYHLEHGSGKITPDFIRLVHAFDPTMISKIYRDEICPTCLSPPCWPISLAVAADGITLRRYPVKAVSLQCIAASDINISYVDLIRIYPQYAYDHASSVDSAKNKNIVKYVRTLPLSRALPYYFAIEGGLRPYCERILPPHKGRGRTVYSRIHLIWLGYIEGTLDPRPDMKTMRWENQYFDGGQ